MENLSTVESNFKVSISETDCRNNVKSVVILNYMQDLAARSIEKYDEKFCCEELLKNNRGWFLIRYRIEFDNYEIPVKELKIKTQCRGAQKMTTYRDFEVFNAITSQRILRAFSSWFIVDINKKSVVNIQQEYPEFFEYEKRDDDLVLTKLRPIQSADIEKLFHVRFDDLDINNHVNNTVYVSWALEALDYDFRLSHRLKSLDIYFKHEAKYTDDVISKVKISDDNLKTEHLIVNSLNGEDLCLIQAAWEIF